MFYNSQKMDRMIYNYYQIHAYNLSLYMHNCWQQGFEYDTLSFFMQWVRSAMPKGLPLAKLAHASSSNDMVNNNS